MIDRTVDTITYNRYYKVTSAPIEEPVTVEEVKDFARIDGNDEDSMIATFITTVRQMTEKYCNRALQTQTIRFFLDEWNIKEISLPRPPLISVTSIVTLDEDDTETTYSSNNYFVNTTAEPGKVIIKNDVSVPINTDRDFAGYKITYTAGYGATRDYIPQAIKTAILLWCTAVYEKRDLQGEPPPDAKELLKAYRIINI